MVKVFIIILKGQVEQGTWEDGVLTAPIETIQNSKFHAIVVGINEYDEMIDLKYASK